VVAIICATIEMEVVVIPILMLRCLNGALKQTLPETALQVALEVARTKESGRDLAANVIVSVHLLPSQHSVHCKMQKCAL
jgi:hypothetical protein